MHTAIQKGIEYIEQNYPVKPSLPHLCIKKRSQWLILVKVLVSGNESSLSMIANSSVVLNY